MAEPSERGEVMGAGARGDGPARAILPRGRRRGRPARDPRRPDRAEPAPAAAQRSTRRRSPSWPSRSARAGCSSRSWCGRSPAAATSWWPASGACARRRSPSSSRSRRWCARPTTGSGSTSRWPRTWRGVDLNPVEEARACAMLVDDLGLTKEEVGRRVGRSRVAISNLIRLLDLPEEALELIEAGALSEGHGRAILLCKDHAARRRLALAPATAPGRCARPSARARGGGEPEPEPPRAARWSTPTWPRRSPRRRTRSAALGREVKVRARGDGCVVEIEFDHPPRPSSWPSRCSRGASARREPGPPHRRPDATIGRRGRLAQPVRARL